VVVVGVDLDEGVGSRVVAADGRDAAESDGAEAAWLF
jgi:hypothetical protein